MQVHGIYKPWQTQYFNSQRLTAFMSWYANSSGIEGKITMSILKSLFLRCPSKIPMPRAEDKRNMRYLICGFSFVGMVIGLLLRAGYAE